MWCSRKESNLRPPPYQGGALPTELREQVVRRDGRCNSMVERETGIEPALVAWKATVLPLNYSRAGSPACVAPLAGKAAGYRVEPWNFEAGGGRWIRTTEGVSQQIYSLPPLAAWVSLR